MLSNTKTVQNSKPWTNLKWYAFPPFSLIGRCLSKIQCKKVLELILIAPVWPTQPWYPILKVSLLQEVILPHSQTYSKMCGVDPHPLLFGTGLSNPTHMACVWANPENKGISEQASCMQPSFFLHGGKTLKLHIPVAGGNGSSGAHTMDLNLFVHL